MYLEINVLQGPQLIVPYRLQVVVYYYRTIYLPFYSEYGKRIHSDVLNITVYEKILKSVKIKKKLQLWNTL